LSSIISARRRRFPDAFCGGELRVSEPVLDAGAGIGAQGAIRAVTRRSLMHEGRHIAVQKIKEEAPAKGANSPC
jgi:hypothetical protein